MRRDIIRQSQFLADFAPRDVCCCLFLDAIDAERHGRQMVGHDGLLLVAATGDDALHGLDELRMADAVLVVHTVMAE